MLSLYDVLAFLGFYFVVTECVDVKPCGDNQRLRVNQVNLSPSNIRPGQDLTVDATWNIVQDIEKPVKAQIKLYRRIGFNWRVEIPCQNNIGSCTYDLCTKGATPFCQTNRGMHQTSGFKLKIPNLPQAALGDYDFEIRGTDGKNRNIGCWTGSAKLVK